jgi:hypothetical protein
MTNYQLRGQIGGQLVAIDNMYNQIDGVDDTPMNRSNRDHVDKAWSALMAVYDSLPADNNSISSSAASQYNKANALYKAAQSTLTEFGSDSYPSFFDAVVESAKELPQTLGDAGSFLGNAVGGVVGGVGNFGAEAIKNTILRFFKSLGWFGWILLVVAALGVLTYFYPGWIGAAKGLVRK